MESLFVELHFKLESLFVELQFKCVVGIYCSPNVEAKLIIYSPTSKFMHVTKTFKEDIRISKERANKIWSDGHLEKIGRQC